VAFLNLYHLANMPTPPRGALTYPSMAISKDGRLTMNKFVGAVALALVLSFAVGPLAHRR
jgi:hypothetical protein